MKTTGPWRCIEQSDYDKRLVVAAAAEAADAATISDELRIAVLEDVAIEERLLEDTQGDGVLKSYGKGRRRMMQPPSTTSRSSTT